MGERKFLRTFICLTLMLSILLGTFGAQAAERTVTILELTNDFVYIRSSTGENSQIIGTLAEREVRDIGVTQEEIEAMSDQEWYDFRVQS